MAYCPQCGREQNCGCEECHTCGVRLVTREVRKPAARSRPESERSRSFEKARPTTAIEPEEHRYSLEAAGPDEVEGVASKPITDILPMALAVLGSGVLIIVLFEIARQAREIINLGGGFGTPPVTRLGYYIGHLMYTSSARILIGFAVIMVGLLIDPPRPFSRRLDSLHVLRATGLLMALTAVTCVLSVIFIIVPLGGPSMITRSLLPALWVAIPVLLIMGISLSVGSYLVFSRMVGMLPSSPHRGMDRGGGQSFRSRVSRWRGKDRTGAAEGNEG